MFKSIHYDVGNTHKITDSYFEETVNMMPGGGYCSSVIAVYEKRNLPVAKNIIRYFMWNFGAYPLFDLQFEINRCKKQEPGFDKYEEDIQKYLVLL